MSIIKSTSDIKWDRFLFYDETSPSCLRRKEDWVLPKFGRKDDLYVREPSGSPVGIVESGGYWVTCLDGELYKCHRVVYELCIGRLGDMFVDHINGVRTDNRIENLRAVSRSLNSKNRCKQVNNTSGKTGVARKSQVTDGKLYNYWVAVWVDSKGKLQNKNFNTEKYGDEGAFVLASEYRDKKISEMNTEGAGYTDNHGL